jgi:competence protein ComEC
MRPIIVVCAWVLGISVVRFLPTTESSFWIAALIISSLVGLLFRRQLAWWILVSLAAFFAGGFRQSLLPISSEIANYNGYSGTITGLVVAEPELREDKIQLRIASETIFVNSKSFEASGLVLVEANRGAEVQYGDRIRATGRLAVPATWGTFSYADYLARHSVFSMMQGAGVEVVDSGRGSALISALLNLKEIVQRSIASALPEPQAGLLTGILLGDESGIAPELKEAFTRVGASHVVAISGFNMVIVSGIVLRVLSGLFRGSRTVVMLNALSVIAVYSLLVGASPGVLRAALMSSLLVIGSQLNRKAFVPTSLAIATLLLSLFDPNVLLDIGFQLSFFAVLGLSLFADPLSFRFRRLLDKYLPMRVATDLHSFLNEPLIVSIAAQITILPLIILYFGRLSLVALPVNLLIVPVQSAVLLLGMAGAVAHAFIPVVGTLIFWAELVFISWTISVVRGFAELSFAELIVDLDGRLIQAFYLLLIGGAMIHAARPTFWQRLQVFVGRNTVLLSTCATSAVVLILMGAMLLSRADGHLHVWLLDVAHSNAVLAQTPGGVQMLVDGGRFPSRLLTAIGDRLPFYDREIEILVITHPDAWDIAALNSVLDRYSVGAVLYHGQANTVDTFESIYEGLQESDTPIVKVRAGHRVELSDGAAIEVLHPQTQPKIANKLNDHVLVLRVTYGAVSFLLTSDLSAAGQREMLKNGVSPRANVLQIPQHGAARSIDGDFLDLVQPQIALLQSDIANRRGDPDPDVLAEFRDVILLRTDELGTIHLRTDGKTIQVSRQFHMQRD